MTSVLGRVLKKKTKDQKTWSFKSAWETNLFQDEEDDMVALNVFVSEKSMSVVPSALFGLLLNSQWALSPADSLSTEQGVVDMLSFAPQNPVSTSIEKIRRGEQQRDSEVFMMEAEVNCSKKRVTIDSIGTISLVQDVLKTCANWVCM